MSSMLFFSVANAGAIVGFLLLCAKNKQNKPKSSKAKRAGPPSQSAKGSVSKQQSVSLKKQDKSSIEVKTAIENKSERPPIEQEKKSEIKVLSVSQKIGKPLNEDEVLQSQKSSISQTAQPKSESAYVLKVGEQVPKEESLASANNIQQQAIQVEPKELRFTGKGGESKLKFENNTGNRVAVKMKCSDNALFSLNPVYMFIEKDGKATVDVSRLDAAPKPDKLEVVYADAADSMTDAQALFKNGAATEKLSVPVFVV